ncbi:50S ribosomal protein L6 [Planctomicrobium sp. SH527]|uniref:50S ribosomal protein L6 n=1 Tax=Planctomicrobium sp. SH527 TaxID=3448123 RepID=UPI003F5BCE6D
MSRIGKKPIAVNAGVDVAVDGSLVKVKGKNGELSLACHPNISVSWDSSARVITVERPNDQRENRALHGLTRALVANMVQGVQVLFEEKLEIQGVGYQASLSGNVLSLQVGFANVIKLTAPSGVLVEVASPTSVIVRGADKHAVGQFAANVRRVRPPEPYKGKGIRYVGEVVRRKSGKAFGS